MLPRSLFNKRHPVVYLNSILHRNYSELHSPNILMRFRVRIDSQSRLQAVKVIN